MPFVKPRHKPPPQTADHRQPFFPASPQLLQRSQTTMPIEGSSTFFRPRTTTGSATIPSNLMASTHPQISQVSPQPLARPGSQYINCTLLQKLDIDRAVQEARRLVQRALNQLNRMNQTGVSNKYTAHFGSAPLSAVISRYQSILGSLGNKRFICSDCSDADKGTMMEEEIPEAQLQDPSHLCGMAPVPGNTIILCPSFFYSARNANKKNNNNRGNNNLPCYPPGTIIHEAAHNAGASGDIPPGSNAYPPQNAEENAYSYEMFAILP